MDALFDVKAVIFDNDGTLVNSMPGIVRAFAQLIEEYQVDPDGLDELHGRSSGDIIRALVGEQRADEATKRIDELEVEHADDTLMHPGVADALAAIPTELVAVASSGTRSVIEARLAAAGIAKPAVVVSANDVEHAKPAPDIFQLACQRLGFEPAQCLVVEDSAAGVQAGKAAGCPVLAVLTTSPRADLEAAGADHVVELLDQVQFSYDAGQVLVTGVRS